MGCHRSEIPISRSSHVDNKTLTDTPMNHTATMCRTPTEETLRQAQCLGQPVHNYSLELRNSRAADPVEVCPVEGIGIYLCQSGWIAARTWEECHEARTTPVSNAWEDLGLDVLVDGGPRFWVCWRRGG